MCSWAIGSQIGSIDRFEYVHCSVPIYDLCLPLFDGLVEHILVELYERIGSAKYANDNDVKDTIIVDIKLLIKAAGLSSK